MSILRLTATPPIGGRSLPFARGVAANGFLFVSGQVGANEDGAVVSGGIAAETRQAMDNIVSILREAGYSLSDVVKVNVWLDDPRDFAAFNAVYAGYFGDALPARSCVRSQLMIDAKVEIDAIAYRKP